MTYKEVKVIEKVEDIQSDLADLGEILEGLHYDPEGTNNRTLQDLENIQKMIEEALEIAERIEAERAMEIADRDEKAERYFPRRTVK